MAFRLAVFLLGFAVSSASHPADLVGSDATPIFESEIEPLLKEKCGKCHSDRVQKGGLDLSTMKGLRRGGESGDQIVTESVAESHLWSVIEGGEMPPEDQPPLTDGERDLVRRWIVGGARSQAQPSMTRLNQHDVLPIVLLRCVTCHGARLKQGGVDLRTRVSMLEGGENGPAMVPGDANASRMIERIESEACPPSELLLKFFVRRPNSSELRTLREWIDLGAPETDVVADAGAQPDPLITEAAREHWAFQPPKKSLTFKAMDDFIVDRLSDAGLTLSPEADRDTLIRRVYFDLIGLPPTLDEYERWRQCDDPDWYASMVDDLLASPHYGERWGRYWLDLAGYADSEGGTSADPPRPVAWKYRDYVIDAFNTDKPYDRFLLEQLAGDELLDYDNAKVVTDEMVNHLIATGFLRMGIDETGSRTMNFVPERLKVISDAITVTSSALMALTMECARCHSHKYDPIAHRDYYQFKAIFQGALDEHDWSSFKTRMLKVATPEQVQRVAEVNPPLQAEVKKLESRHKQLTSELQLVLLRHYHPQQSEADNQQTLAALKVADNNRTLIQKVLAERLLEAELQADLTLDSQLSDSIIELRQELIEVQRRIDQIRRQMEPDLEIRALWDLGRPSPTYILRRGEHDKPGDWVGPAVPSALSHGPKPFVVLPPFPGGTAKTGRRLALARWLTDRNHPLTARVMVNRIWYHHFGTGLAKDLENFGIKGEAPSHPELLDWLAIEFMDRGWSIKELHRLMMNSRTYRQASVVTDEQRKLDPQNRLLSRMGLRRLDAEALRDSLLFVSGKLDDSPGGLPDTVTVNREGLVSVNSTDGGGWRRSVYLQYRRTEIPTLMDTFDYPQMGPNCVARNVSTVSPQPLMLLNNRHVRELAAAFAQRVAQMADASSEDAQGRQIEIVYRMALCRSPSDAEREIGIKSLKQMQDAWQSEPRKALESYCHMLFNSAAFLYVD